MAEPTLTPPRATLEDCWNRIGTKGDGSCPELSHHIRCLNCPTFARAAMQQLDRVQASGELAQEWARAGMAAEEVQEDRAVLASALVVRIAGEWLAITTSVVQEVAETRPLHSLPHQRNTAIAGVLNIRGSLRICVSLARVFQLPDDTPAPHLLVAAHEGQILVFPVEEVAGVHRYAADSLAPVPTTLAQAAIQYTRGMVEWRGRPIGLLDHELLFYVLNRSMT
ncbi:chemotaxis protein CheW [Herbaspirillum huttiense F1]|jgi:Chemotaxis signal transduction protein|uniref:chemotaxis protein CheW n=1 Tax=Herbaspirillum TaxID=963 RepID=UPI001066923E|nr:MULTISPECIES: chemotaxis protein CheW [Herbaspirillum]MBP1314078.1 chemotaxis-related protein WspD [Herbaspirillum sp. 1130]MDT0354647.1 chemotaxis protein CheW [Herbaspirillum huttiense F1]